MPYKDKEKLKKYHRERMRLWRSNPDNKKKQNERRNYLRNKELNSVKEYEKEYYNKNKVHILNRCKEYNNTHPEVRKKSQQKAIVLGKSIEKGKKQRHNLSEGYISAQIRKEKSNKSIDEKKREILIYRIKKIINNYE